uniref:Uncharacterized protein n=1 Tax=uncultured marine thaumarchaeote AD1000_100_C06 TaxID=1455887 RepID=A0A075FNB3_9ARCH|nr:hypothetical protein [uncultured marine thaumarchaeote AD1000_100_C06]
MNSLIFSGLYFSTHIKSLNSLISHITLFFHNIQSYLSLSTLFELKYNLICLKTLSTLQWYIEYVIW